jgi:hypothetical protein
MIAAKLIASAVLAASVLTPYRAAPAPAISPTAFDELFGVNATSPQNAWAVGLYVTGPGFRPHTLTEHWNGRTWARVPSPNPAGTVTGVQLNGVAATSSSNAWAVGFVDGRSGLARTLIEHWNGRAWKVQPSPNPGSYSDFLQSVTALSATDAWAVGYYSSSEANAFTLVEHWNGRTWTRVPSPNPTGPRWPALLTGVAAVSPSSIWAVGSYTIGAIPLGIGTLTEHWNGRAWKVAASPNPAGSDNFNELTGVAATSAANAWAVGMLTGTSTGARRAFTQRWNGARWKQAAMADPGTASTLLGVTATSPGSAWAVGVYAIGAGPDRALIERWNGRTWRKVASPGPARATTTDLEAVTATSPASAWAVGYYVRGTQTLTLIEHWNGTAWKLIASANV